MRTYNIKFESRARKTLTSISLYGFLLFVTMFTLLPLVFSFFASFKPLSELMGDGMQILPRTWRWANYSEVWKLSKFSAYFQNSLFVAAGTVAIVVLNSSMFGYVLARKKLKLSGFIEGLFAATIFVGLGSAVLYPLMKIALSLHILNLYGVILVQSAGGLLVNTFLVKSFFQTLNREIDDAALIDGCGFFQVYRHIAFPIMRPIIATVALFTFQGSWNDFLLPLVFTLSNPEMQTIIIGVYSLKNMAEGATSWHYMMAGSIIALTPILLLFLLLQKYFINSMSSGALKG